jgi:hypothetical protein
MFKVKVLNHAQVVEFFLSLSASSMHTKAVIVSVSLNLCGPKYNDKARSTRNLRKHRNRQEKVKYSWQRLI